MELELAGTTLSPRSKPQQLAATMMVEQLSTILEQKSFDLLHEWTKTWDAVITAAKEQGLNPQACGQYMAGAYMAWVTMGEVDINWGLVGRLVQKYGKLGLRGIDAALNAGISEPVNIHRYANKVCQNLMAEHRAGA